MEKTLLFYVGTYSLPILHGTGETLVGRGKGIYIIEYDTCLETFTECHLAAEAENPSFICISRDGRHLYAVNELKEYRGREEGSVSAYAIEDNGGLSLINRKPTGGTDPCHVTMSPDGETLIVSNYMSGSICVYRIGADGSISGESQLIHHSGRGPHPIRQAGPHAHSATFDGDGRLVYVCDLGTDEIKIYEITEPGHIHEVGTYKAPEGSGPRYAERHRNGMLYCINELDCTVSALRCEDNVLAHAGTYPALVNKQGTICAALHISRDQVYCSNRGHDSISSFRIDQDGSLLLEECAGSGGNTPRDFIIDKSGRYLIAANQDSDNVVIFSITSGLQKLSEIEVPTPVCVAQLPN